MNYHIRLARHEEMSLLAAIELAAAQRFSEEDLPEPMRSSYTVPLPYLEQAYDQHALWVAEDGKGKPIGYCFLRQADGLTILQQIDVLPEHGRRGIGRALVGRALERAGEMGSRFVYLTTFCHIPFNAPFYAGLGFAVVPDNELPASLLETLKLERTMASNRVAMVKPL